MRQISWRLGASSLNNLISAVPTICWLGSSAGTIPQSDTKMSEALFSMRLALPGDHGCHQLFQAMSQSDRASQSSSRSPIMVMTPDHCGHFWDVGGPVDFWPCLPIVQQLPKFVVIAWCSAA